MTKKAAPTEFQSPYRSSAGHRIKRCSPELRRSLAHPAKGFNKEKDSGCTDCVISILYNVYYRSVLGSLATAY